MKPPYFPKMPRKRLERLQGSFINPNGNDYMKGCRTVLVMSNPPRAVYWYAIFDCNFELDCSEWCNTQGL